MKPFNKNISFLLLCSLVCLFTACSSAKDQAFARLSNLYEDARVNSKSYTAEQWGVYLSEYQVVDSLISECSFSGDEQSEVRRMKGRCAAYAREGTMVVASRQVNTTLSQTRGMLKGYSDTRE